MFDYNKYFQCSKNAKYIVCMCSYSIQLTMCPTYTTSSSRKKMFIMKIKIKNIEYKNYF